MAIRASRNVLDAAISTDPTCLIIGSIFLSPDSLNAFIGTGTGVKQLAFANGSTSNVISSATPATTRVIDGEASFSAASVAPSGSIVGVRGAVTIPAGTTLTSGYVYGTQGKVVIQGTVTATGGANAATGIQGQLDLSAATGLTSGYVSAGWFDMGATASAAAITGQANLTILELDNTTNAVIHSIILSAANASYFFDVTDLAYGGSHFVVGTTAATAAGTLKVRVNGADRYIQLYSSES
jgi:hypothetical protein